MIYTDMFEVAMDWLETSDHGDSKALRAYTNECIKEMQKIILELIEEGGAEIHDDPKGCPEDDTCACPLAKRIKAALHNFKG